MKINRRVTAKDLATRGRIARFQRHGQALVDAGMGKALLTLKREDGTTEWKYGDLTLVVNALNDHIVAL